MQQVCCNQAAHPNKACLQEGKCEIRKRTGISFITVLCAGAISLLHGFIAFAGPYYCVGLDPENVLEAQTVGMSSNERLTWYLEQTGQEADPAVEEAQAQVNPECVGILNVGGEIEEYVTQTDNNDFYLDHNAYGEEDVNGSVFIDSRCDFFPRDHQIIIHGHNMKGGAVFGRLNEYRDLLYLKAHPLITLQTLAGIEYYAPYAITDVNVDMDADNYFLEIMWRFDPDSFAAYTGSLKGKSYYNIPVEAEFSDRLLILSTCSYVYSDSRFLICARKLRDTETVEEMTGLVSQSTMSGTSPDDVAPYTGGGDYESLTLEDYNNLLYETEADIVYVQNAPSDLIEG